MMATTRTVTLEELGVVLDEITDKAPLALKAAVQVQAMHILRTVVMGHMSGQSLGIVTGTARRSMVGLDGPGSVSGGAFGAETRARTRVETGRVVTEMGSPLAYVRAHEEGFSGPVQVRAHVRRLVALKRNAQGKVTKKSAKAYKRAIRDGRATSSNVRAYTRQVNMRARAFLRKSIRQVEHKFPDRVKRALMHLANTGKVPKLSDIAGGSGA